MKRCGVEHGKLPIQQIDQLRAVSHVRRGEPNPFVSLHAIERFGRTVSQGHPVPAGRGEQPGDGRPYLPGADDDDILHAASMSRFHRSRTWA
jgi:hypothetical protein